MLESLILFELNHLCYNYLTIFMFTLLIQITVYKLAFIQNSDFIFAYSNTSVWIRTKYKLSKCTDLYQNSIGTNFFLKLFL